MKVILVVGMLLIFLTGCGVQTAQWETIGDFTPEMDSILASELYGITTALPETAITDSSENRRCYELNDLQIEVSTFFASDAETAIKNLSGFSMDKLTVLQTERFSMPEYQFAWFSQTEEGGRLCRADLVMDGMVCYSIVCSAAEDAGDTVWEEATQVFSSFGLSPAKKV